MAEKSHWVFVVNQAQKVDGRIKPAVQVCEQRLKAGVWPIYTRTPNRKQLASGDTFVIYLAGHGQSSQCFVATGTISATNVPVRNKAFMDGDEALRPPIEALLALSEIALFQHPVNARELLQELSIMPANKRNWGGVFQKGCKRISSEDHHLILRKGSGAK